MKGYNNLFFQFCFFQSRFSRKQSLKRKIFILYFRLLFSRSITPFPLVPPVTNHPVYFWFLNPAWKLRPSNRMFLRITGKLSSFKMLNFTTYFKIIDIREKVAVRQVCQKLFFQISCGFARKPLLSLHFFVDALWKIKKTRRSWYPSPCTLHQNLAVFVPFLLL